MTPITEKTYRERRDRVRKSAHDAGAGNVVSADPADIRYLTGVGVGQGLLVLNDGGGVLVTDARHQHLLAAFRPAEAWITSIVDPGVGAAARDWARAVCTVTGDVAVDPEHVSTSLWHALASMLPRKIVSAPGVISRVRAKKTTEEIERIERAADIAGRAYLEALSSLHPQLTEWQFANRVESIARDLGADAMAFNTMTGFGPRSAEPGARASNNPLRGEGWLMVDWGVAVDGYVCDMARSAYLGECSPLHRRDYAVVSEALNAGVASIHPGIRCADVFEAIRRVLAEAREEDRFRHLAGHSVGLGPHEPPFIHPYSDWQIEAGYVMSVEVGLYRLGEGGIRLEQQIAATDAGCRLLSEVPSLELTEIHTGFGATTKP